MAARKTTDREECLTPLECLALANHFKKLGERHREEADVGDGQGVDLTVRLFGMVNVGEGYKQNSFDRPELVDVLAIALGTAPEKKFTDALLKHYKRLNPAERPELDAELLAKARKLADAITHEKKISCRGRVTVAAVHELVNRT